MFHAAPVSSSAFAQSPCRVGQENGRILRLANGAGALSHALFQAKEASVDHVVHQHIDAEQRCDHHRKGANCRETSDAPRSPSLFDSIGQCANFCHQGTAANSSDSRRTPTQKVNKDPFSVQCVTDASAVMKACCDFKFRVIKSSCSCS